MFTCHCIHLCIEFYVRLSNGTYSRRLLKIPPRIKYHLLHTVLLYVLQNMYTHLLWFALIWWCYQCLMDSWDLCTYTFCDYLLALGQSCDCSSVSEITLKDMGQCLCKSLQCNTKKWVTWAYDSWTELYVPDMGYFTLNFRLIPFLLSCLIM